MSWDWTVLLLVDAALLVAATLTIIALFLRDLRRPAPEPPAPDERPAPGDR